MLFRTSVAMSARAECPVRDCVIATKSKIIQVDYRWAIPNFATQVSDGWTSIAGPVVYGSGKKVYWKLHMVPDCDGYLCVEVRQCEFRNAPSQNRAYDYLDSKIQVALRASVCNSDGTSTGNPSTSQQVSSGFVVLGKGLVWKLAKRDTILANRVQYLPAGKLTLFCTLRYVEPESTQFVNELEYPIPVPVLPSPEIAWCMGNVLADGMFSDVVVVAGEREFPVHRAILAERSDVFRAMFDANMTETQQKRVVIEDLSADAVSDLLAFIYTDSAPNIEQVARELLVAAEKYDISRLKAACEVELAKNLDIDNVIDILIEAEMYRADQLKETALHWIAKHAPDVVQTTSWKSLCKDHPGLVTAVCEQCADYIEELTY